MGNNSNNGKRNLKNSAKTIGKGVLHGTSVISRAAFKAGKGIVSNKDVKSLAAIGLTIGATVAFSSVVLSTAVLGEIANYGLSSVSGRPYHPGRAIGTMYGAGRAAAKGATEIIGETAGLLFGLGETISDKVADKTR